MQEYWSTDDQYAALQEVKKTCWNCGSRSSHLQDGWCPRCNGSQDDADAEVREANRRAGERARADQRRRHPEWF
jgi:hypothetical protein